MSLLVKAQVALAYPFALLTRVKLRLLGVEFGEGVTFFGSPIVAQMPGTTIKIGSHVQLCSWSWFTALGVNHPVVLRTLEVGAQIEIGDHVGISGGSICAAKSVSIGSYTMFGANVTVADTDFHPLKAESRRYSNEGVNAAPVVIGRNVFVGTGSIILKGVHIGDNCVIGAGAVVTHSIPSNTIAAGNPCKVLRSLLEAENVKGQG